MVAIKRKLNQKRLSESSDSDDSGSCNKKVSKEESSESSSENDLSDIEDELSDSNATILEDFSSTEVEKDENNPY